MKRFSLKRVYLFCSSLFIFLLHLPFVFAKNKPSGTVDSGNGKLQPVVSGASLFHQLKHSVEHTAGSLYDTLRLNILGLSQQAFDYAIKGLHYLSQSGKVENDGVITIADFSLPSSQKRLFVIDLNRGKVLYNTYVAHGMNSGREYARQFSNTPESNQSSPGFYETGSTYMGSNGYSLRLEGLERGINDNAGRRDIVMHGAAYVCEEYVRSQGYIGRSQGCPAVPVNLSKPIIDKIKNGTCLFIYSNTGSYIHRSSIVNL